MRVKCEFIIFPGKFFVDDVQTKKVIASGSESNVSLRHSARHLVSGGEPCNRYTLYFFLQNKNEKILMKVGVRRNPRPNEKTQAWVSTSVFLSPELYLCLAALRSIFL